MRRPWLVALPLLLGFARPLQAQDVSGTWKVELSAQQGGDAFTLTLTVKGEDVSGTIGDDETLTGTFKDGRLELSGQHYVDQAGYAALLEMEGTVDGDRIRGTASWDGYAADMEGRRAS